MLELVRVRRNASFVLNYNGNDNFKPSRYLKVELCITPSILLRHWAVAEQRPTFPALPHAVGVVSFNTGTPDVGFHSNVEGLDQGSMTCLQRACPKKLNAQYRNQDSSCQAAVLIGHVVEVSLVCTIFDQAALQV